MTRQTLTGTPDIDGYTPAARAAYVRHVREQQQKRGEIQGELTDDGSLSFDLDQVRAAEVQKHLAPLKEALVLRRRIDDAVTDATTLATSNGATWQQIADLMRCTRQSAHETHYRHINARTFGR